MKRTILLAALASSLSLGMPFVTDAVAATRKAHKEATLEEKVVYHINDASNARVAMRNIENHLNASPNARIVVVAHGKGIDFLLNDAADEKGPFQTQVAGLKNRGVDFRVCHNTLAGRKLEDNAVIFEASVVPSGVAELGRLQSKEGYAYIKP